MLDSCTKLNDFLKRIEATNIEDISERSYLDIHLHFEWKGLMFSIIWLQKSEEKGYWEIFCIDIENGIDRANDLDRLLPYMEQCLEKFESENFKKEIVKGVDNE